MDSQPQQFTTTQLFTQALTTPVIMSHSQQQQHQLQRQLNTPPPSSSPSDSHANTAVKLEDLAYPTNFSLLFSTPPPTSHPDSKMSPAPSSAADDSATPANANSSSETKSAKKRKSWGQVLPEPKTCLPPRKRAKTEDEKEQRRIERVKRNRLAAHNSRERKRQEVELLQKEKETVEARLQAALAMIARQASEIKTWRQRYPGEVVDSTFDSAPALDDSFESLNTVCPRQTSFPSPISMDSMDSPRDDSCAPETPAYTESVATDLDQTRYPAAILCDLQCQSRSLARSPQWRATLCYLSLFTMTLHSMKSLSTTFSASILSLNARLLLISSTLLSSTPFPLTLTALVTRSMLSPTSNRTQPLAQRFPLATRPSQMKGSSNEWVSRLSAVAEGLVPTGAGVQDNRHLGPREFGKDRRRQVLSTIWKSQLDRWRESWVQQNTSSDWSHGQGQLSRELRVV